MEYNPWQGPAYPLALAGWGALVGWTAFAGRTFSLLAGMLAIAWTYRLGRDMASPRVGLGASLALAASAFFVDYLHELRAYTLYALFTAMALWAYWRMITRHPGPVTQALFVVGLLGLEYTHYFAALAAVGIGLYHLLFVRKTVTWWRVVILMGMAALLFAPWLTVMLKAVGLATGDAARQVRAMDAAEVLQLLAYALSNGFVVLLVVIGVSALARGRNVGLLWFVAACILALGLLLNAFVPLLTHIRYLMALWPVLALLFGLGLEQLSRRGIRAEVVLVIWIGAGLWNTADPVFIDTLFRQVHTDLFRPRLPLHLMTREVSANLQTGDAVAFDAPVHAWALAGAFDYYMHPLPIEYTMLDWLSTSSNADLFHQKAQEFIGNTARAWVGVEQDRPPDFRLGEFERVLDENGFVPCGNRLDLPNLRLDLYARAPDCCAPPTNLDEVTRIRFGDGVRLTYLSPLPSEIGDMLTLTTAWSVAPEVARNTYSVALHVTNANGELAAQADYGLPTDVYACRVSNISLTDLPPGEYTLLTTVYNWASGERLPGVRVETGEEGDRLALMRFRVSN